MGRDQYEVGRWEGRHRHVTRRLLAHAFLAGSRAEAKAAGKGGAASLIRLTAPERPRPLLLAEPAAPRPCRLHWLRWRR